MKSLLLLLLSLALPPVAGASVAVNVRGVDYEVSTVFGTGWDGYSVLSQMTWWGNPGLASDFATAVELQLGATNNGVSDVATPLFASHYYSTFRRSISYQYSKSMSGQESVKQVQTSMSSRAHYAITTERVVAIVPPPPVESLVVNVRGVNYMVSSVFATGWDAYSTLSQMAWWGNYALANDFAKAVELQLGSINNGFAYDAMPLFASDYHSNFRRSISYQYSLNILGQESVDQVQTDMDFGAYYAIAEKVAVPTPSTISLLGPGLIWLLGFAWSNKQKSARSDGDSAPLCLRPTVSFFFRDARL